MIFDDLGLPRDNGATDYLDSARLAGLMVLFDFPEQKPDLEKYIVNGKPTRHPRHPPNDFSRDQLMCLSAGLWKIKSPLISQVWQKPANGDWLSPSHTDHGKRIMGMSDTWIGRIWLKADIAFNACFDPLTEPNQLISMLMVAGPEWVHRWQDANRDWRDAIDDYWSSWRDEDDLADCMIAKLESL